MVDARPTDDDENDGGDVDVVEDERSRLSAKLAARPRRRKVLSSVPSVVLEKARALCHNIRRVRRVESTSTSLEGILLECSSGGDLEDRSDTRNRERGREREENNGEIGKGELDIDTILDFGVESPESTSVPLDLRAGPLA